MIKVLKKAPIKNNKNKDQKYIMMNSNQMNNTKENIKNMKIKNDHQNAKKRKN